MVVLFAFRVCLGGWFLGGVDIIWNFLFWGVGFGAVWFGVELVFGDCRDLAVSDFCVLGCDVVFLILVVLRFGF